MASHREVLAFLRPNGGYVSVGENFEGITFESQCEPFTKAEYEAAFGLIDSIKTEATAKREVLLDKLGITEEEAKLLLG